jgi:CheY-like chemotaxis protein
MNLFPEILLVDDDDDYLYIARRAIERTKLHAEVRVAHDGAEALRMLGLRPGGAEQVSPFTVVVVLLDLRMPGVSGWDVLRQIRENERTRALPVVMVSTSDRGEDVLRSYDSGANSYVVKRLDEGSPGGYVAEMARYWVEINQPSRQAGGPRQTAPA